MRGGWVYIMTKPFGTQYIGAAAEMQKMQAALPLPPGFKLPF